MKSDWVGRIVANDQTAAMVVATLMENDPETGERLDLQEVAKALEAIRGKYEKDGTTVHIIGFAKAMGDIARAPPACWSSSAWPSWSRRSCSTGTRVR